MLVVELERPVDMTEASDSYIRFLASYIIVKVFFKRLFKPCLKILQIHR